jgi:glycine oxidase
MYCNAYIACMLKSPKTNVVIGGGIVGLVSALGATERGPVAIFDPQIGSGATFAAAGMLSPGAELLAGEQHALGDAMIALRGWPDFLQLLDGVENIYFPEAGSLLTGYTRGDNEEIKRLTAMASTAALTCESVTRSLAPSRFEEISPRFEKGVFFVDDAFVNVEALVDALVTTLKSRGALFIEEPVIRIEEDSAAVVHTTQDSYSYDAGLVCAGARTGLLGGDVSSTLRSVRGVTRTCDSSHGSSVD